MDAPDSSGQSRLSLEIEEVRDLGPEPHHDGEAADDRHAHQQHAKPQIPGGYGSKPRKIIQTSGVSSSEGPDSQWEELIPDEKMPQSSSTAQEDRISELESELIKESVKDKGLPSETIRKQPRQQES